MELVHHQGWAPNSEVMILMELCDGSLADLIPSYRPLSTIPEILEPWLDDFISNALSDLSYIHKAGFTHRDLKPENILYKKDPRSNRYIFRVADFGLATSKSLSPGAGTMHFMAPETIAHSQCAWQADIHGFGLTLLAAMGVWHQSYAYHADVSESAWERFLSHNTGRHCDYRDALPTRDPVIKSVQCLNSRFQSLFDASLVDPALRCMLHTDYLRRVTASEARRSLAQGAKENWIRAVRPEGGPRAHGRRAGKDPRVVVVEKFERAGPPMELPVRHKWVK